MRILAYSFPVLTICQVAMETISCHAPLSDGVSPMITLCTNVDSLSGSLCVVPQGLESIASAPVTNLPLLLLGYAERESRKGNGLRLLKG